MENTFCFDVDTPRGIGILQMVYETELGILMGKVFYPNEKIFINYQMSDLSEKMNLSYNPSKIGKQRRQNQMLV